MTAQTFGRWQVHVKGLLLTGGLQAGIQMLGFVSGLAVIRLLPVREYAFYTIANATLGTLTVLTDSGVSQWVMARGGRVWQDRQALGSVVACGMNLRRRFAAIAAIATIPVLYLLLRQQGASMLTALLVSASIIPIFISTLTAQLFEVVSKLHQEILPLQRIQISGALMRLASTAAAVALLPYAWIAGISAGFAQAWMAWQQRRLAGRLAQLNADPILADRLDLARQVRRMAPGAVYYAFSGQINVWLISVFGDVDVVAQVGALGRLAMAFNILMAVFSMLFVPRFARLSLSGTSVLRWFWRAQGGLVVLLAAVVVWVAIFPSAALALLGPKYALLRQEVVLAAAGGAVALLAGSAYALAAARAVVLSPLLVLPLAIALQVLLVLVLPMSTAAGVLWLGILTNAYFWLINTVYFSKHEARAN